MKLPTTAGTSRNLTVAVIAVVVIVLVLATILVYTNPPGSGAITFPSGGTESFPTTSSSNYSTTSSTSTSSSSLSVPPPETTVIHYGCGVSKASPALVLVNTSAASDIDVNLKVSPTLTLMAATCSYTYTNTTTPVACGVMCGGGIGFTYVVSDVWSLNFSLSSPSTPGSYNLTIGAGNGMSALLPGLDNQVYLNSQQVTSWYSNPPCYEGDGIESDCMVSNATSITIELPTPVDGGAYDLKVVSGETLVPIEANDSCPKTPDAEE